jgi:uncharacterized membrane protein
VDYLTVKWLHVLSSTVLFGTGLGSAFYLFSTSRTADARVIAVVARRVVLADWLFTTPTAIIQPATGFYLAHLAGLPLSATWLWASIALYVVAAACWIAVLPLQIRMAAIARAAAVAGSDLPPGFWRYHAAWIALGVPAFAAFVAIFWLMVVKPG